MMRQSEVLQEIVENILESDNVGPMSTIKEDKPHSRYMTFVNDDLTLYTATSKLADKTEEIEANPYTHILLGYEGEGFNDEFVEYTGKIALNDDPELKEKMWNDYMKEWFDGPEDDNLVILEISPENIRVMNKENMQPRDLEV